MILVTDGGMETEAKNRLARIGFDNVIGHLDDPVKAFSEHPDEVAHCKRYDVRALEQLMTDVEDLQVVDVRQPGETANGTIPGAVEIPLTELNQRLGSLDPAKPTVVYCAGGYRSSVAASLMRNAGFEEVADIDGGWGAWTARAGAAV